MNWLRLILLSLTSLMLLLLVLTGLLLFTATGNQLLWQQLRAALPGLQGELSAGHLGVGWELRHLSWHSAIIDLDAERLDLQWQLGALLSGRLPVDKLLLNKARIVLHPLPENSSSETSAEPPVADSAPLRLALPLDLQLADVRLDDVRFDSPYIRVTTDHLALRGQWQGEQLAIQHASIDGVDVALPDAVLDSPAAPSTSQLPADDTPLKQPFSAQEIRQRIETLPEVILPFDIQVAQLEARRIRYHQRGFDTQSLDFDLTGQFVGNTITVSQLNVSHPWGDAQLNGSIQLAGYYPIHARVRGVERWPALPAPLSGRQLDLQVDGPLTDLQATLSVSGAEKLRLSARLNTLAPDLPFELASQWASLQWPLSGKAEYQATKGQLKLTGRLSQYQLQLDSALQLPELPKGKLGVALTGSLDGVVLKQLKLALGESHLMADGKLDWRKGLHWQGKTQLQGSNLHNLLPALSGRISAEVDSQFQLQGTQWTLKLDKLQANGQLNGYPLSLQGKLSGNQQMHWTFENIRLSSGQNRLQLDGSLGERWQARGSLQATDLKQLHPDLAGSASAKLLLSGTRRAPELAVTLTSDELSLPDMRLRQVALDGALKMGALWSGHLQTSIGRVRSGDLRFTQFALQLTGDERAHQLQMSVDGQPLSAALQVNGSWTRAGWQGALETAHIKTPVANWVLQSPLQVALSRALTTLTLSEQCWLADKQGMLCTAATRLNQSQGEIALSLKNFPTQKLEPYLPERLAWISELNATGRVGWHKQIPTAELTLTAEPGKLIADRFETQYDALQLKARLEEQQADFSLHFASRQLGKADIQLQVDEPMKARKLSGNVDISGLRLYGIAPLMDELKRTRGRVDAHGRMAGTLEKPLFYGKVTLDEGEIETSADIAVIRQLHSELDIRGARADLSGSMNVGKGKLDLGGFADWSGSSLNGRLTLHADTLEVGLAGYGRARVSSDIVMALGEAMSIEGRVMIPWARIKVKSVPDSAVSVSEDVQVITKRRQNAPPPPKPLPIKLDLTVGLGGDVQLDALGLKTKLLGGVRLSQSPDTPLRADGEISLDDGRFKSFGQNLLIEEGKLRFSGNIASPYLSVKAYRDPDTMEDANVTVGVKVSGPATQPKIEIYSEPQLSETEKLSYLLRGKSTSSSGTTSNDEAMTGILLGAGLSQANGLVSGIGESLGLSDVSLDSTGSGDNTQVSISGYLIPGLQLQYGVGVFTSIAEVKIRYELMPRLYLQALSGLNQALDLFYKFEF